ncbi:type II toxin-antitoxin system VapC family toxin [Tsukamurella sp. 8F]|uniref:type II toxin-antitoxin system VapC family toxin n=1 Tax=unclassified Tsukamurella TaxID=2633480 RepID=UPI0023B935EB|nr:MULTISPECIES: type II toxin-antitoxin system VapC family toxin [unclassified Tsukamurella]MDF0528659.1 type II toxin-antitoxin system VapC family toxin [Tsukamurella sp. 8J]MDF0585621.1 type II toxin-antitoxin system VapC family toxin [Tsukamurella sp. 8F]
MIYLDTSALIKLLVEEEETRSLLSWLAGRKGEASISSDLSRVEVMRTVLRAGESGLVEQARYVLDSLDILPLSEPVIALAETVGSPSLRSLDALHLAAALQVESEVTAFVTYDHRLQEACRDVGLPVAAPGATTGP